MENPNDTSTSSDSTDSTNSNDTSTSEFDDADFNITQEDVFTVRDYLCRSIPLEVAYLILNFAQYWPSVSSLRTDPLLVSASSATVYNTAAYYLLTPAIPAGHRTIQAVAFTLHSCEQGWGVTAQNLGTGASAVLSSFIESLAIAYVGSFHGSYTWFEAGIVRDDREGLAGDLLQLRPRAADAFDAAAFGRDVGREVKNPTFEEMRRWKVQYNMEGSRTVRRYEVVWRKDDVFDDSVEAEARAKGAGTGRGFVSTLRSGDRVALVVRAQYPGWANCVSGASIKIFYSV